MKRYKDIILDYGVNTEYMESFAPAKYEEDDEEEPAKLFVQAHGL